MRNDRVTGVEWTDDLEELRRRFVHDFQYRYHNQSDHYTIVALFAAQIAKEAVEKSNA